MTTEKIIKMAEEAGFTASKKFGVYYFTRGKNLLKVTPGSCWIFYLDPAESQIADAFGTDHGSLSTFLNAQIAIAAKKCIDRPYLVQPSARRYIRSAV